MHEVIFENDGCRIDFHRTTTSPRGLIYTFTPFMFSRLSDEGFGVNFLLREGFDVVAIKSITDSWFQDVPPEAVQLAAELSSTYQYVVNYGSSMGGFAAFAFANIFGARHIIALSPQFSIRDSFDKRWAEQAKAVSAWNFEISEQSCRGCQATVIYDDRLKLDFLQVQKLVSEIPSCEVKELRVPFSGHPSSQFLKDVGLLADVIRSLLDRSDLSSIDYSCRMARRSSLFNNSLGQYAEASGRLKLAVLAISKAEKLSPNEVGFKIHLANLMKKSGNLVEEFAYLRRAASLRPDAEWIRVLLNDAQSRLDEQNGDLPRAGSTQ